MVLLKDGVYCKHRILESARGVSCKASHLVRRLIEGVFKPQAILQSTVSGRTPRAQGKERQQQHVIPLNVTAKNAIIGNVYNVRYTTVLIGVYHIQTYNKFQFYYVAYALEEAQKNHWIPQNASQLQQTIAQKIVELKREHRNKN